MEQDCKSVKAVLEMRDKIFKVESALRKMPQEDLIVRHYHAKGMYARELFIPEGVMLVGEIHKTEHINVCSKGRILVATEEGALEINAPYIVVAKPGIKRVGYALEDTIWITFHENLTNIKDVEEIKKKVIASSYEEFEEHKKLEEPRNSGIYAICNETKEKLYIGSSKRIKRRWREHKRLLNENRHYNKKLQNAWNKYGSDSFSFCMVEDIKNEKMLLEREQYWINTIDPHYNICKSAGRTFGIQHSEEWKREHSKRMMGNKYASGKKVFHSDETKAKISATLKGTKHSPESYIKQSLTMKGRRPSESTREKYRIAQKVRRKREKEEIRKEVIAEDYSMLEDIQGRLN